jgi:uncharacterized protein (TIGR00369 family)
VSALTLERASALLEETPFCRWWGYRVESLADGAATVLLPHDPRHIRPGGVLHGGASAALADVAVWLALMTLVGEEPLAVTVQLSTQCLRGARGDLRCEGRILAAGRRIVQGEAATTDAAGGLVARHALTYVRARDGGHA